MDQVWTQNGAQVHHILILVHDAPLVQALHTRNLAHDDGFHGVPQLVHELAQELHDGFHDVKLLVHELALESQGKTCALELVKVTGYQNAPLIQPHLLLDVGGLDALEYLVFHVHL